MTRPQGPQNAGSAAAPVLGSSAPGGRAEPRAESRIYPKDRRIARRQPFKAKARGVCYKNTLDVGHNIAVKLVDLSETGIRLVANIALDKDQEILILLEGLRHLRPIKTPGTVVWCTPAQDGNFVIGVRFNKYLAYRDFTYLT